MVCRSSENGDVLSKILMGTTFLSQANGNAENPDFCGKSQRTCEMCQCFISLNIHSIQGFEV